MLEARGVSWNANRKTIVADISLQVAKGEFLGLIGPNGSGKSTLMALLGGLCTPSCGSVLLEGMALKKLRRQNIARRIALVEQQAETPERITARQVVELGRIPHLAAFSAWSEHDTAVTDNALGKVDMLRLDNRLWQTLSGGERQRLHFARALAQEPDILLLDELTNHLDIHHQLSLLHLVRREQLTVIAALHDLNHAAMFCDRIAVLSQGRLVALGKPQQVLTTALIRDIFQVEASITHSSAGGIHIRYAQTADILYHPHHRKAL